MSTVVPIQPDPDKVVRVFKRRRKGRRRQITVRFTDAEYAEVLAGARASGWTVAGWTAASSLAAARQVHRSDDR